jgi:AcrR family transcriptional regulator
MLTDKIVNNKIAAAAKSSEKRQRRLPADARDNILAAAEAILTGRGPMALKLSEVAAGAGVANATVLHHFGSIDGVQTALMERMVTNLAARVVAITEAAGGDHHAGMEGAQALFDAFEAQGAARLAAWLVMTGEAKRLSVIREAVDSVVAVTLARSRVPIERAELEDFLLASITLALGSGLFGQTLSTQLGRPDDSARRAAMALLAARMLDSGFI